MNTSNNDFFRKLFSGNGVMMMAVMTIFFLVVLSNYRMNEKLTEITTTQASSNPVNPSNHSIPYASIPEITNKIESDHYEETQKKLLTKLGQLEQDMAGLAANEAGDNLAYLDYEEQHVKEEEQIKKLISQMEKAVVLDKSDIEWSASAVDALYESVNDNDWNDMELLEADCGSSLCRAEIAINSETLEADVHRIPDLIPWNAEVMINRPDLDSDEVIVFIAREDYQLPRPM